jgi:hypothetical protein
MKRIYLLLSIFVITTLACSLTPVTPVPTSLPPDAVLPPTSATPAAIPPTTTPEIFIARTQAIPAHIQLNGITLAVQDASLDVCDLPDCPSAPSGKRYLRVTLQALDLPADQVLDYKNLPQGIAIYDDTGVITPFERLFAYHPAAQQLILYFVIPQAATVFGLQWPGAAEIPLTVVPAPMPTAPPPIVAGTVTTYAPLTFILPPGVALGSSGSEQPRLDGDDAAWWMKTPGHLQVSLADYYVLQGKSHQPLIAVFPAVDYATLVPAAFEAIHRLDNIFYDPSTVSRLENLPAVPFFNDKPMFASNIQMINFQNGKGVRFITQTAQGPVPVNNQELFYHFEGVTSDGVYYVVAILPLTAPALAETNDAAAPLPPGGIAYPGSIEDFPAYYTAVTALLDATAPDAFTPNLAQLDALIQSMQVAP